MSLWITSSSPCVAGTCRRLKDVRKGAFALSRQKGQLGSNGSGCGQPGGCAGSLNRFVPGRPPRTTHAQCQGRPRRLSPVRNTDRAVPLSFSRSSISLISSSSRARPSLWIRPFFQGATKTCSRLKDVGKGASVLSRQKGQVQTNGRACGQPIGCAGTLNRVVRRKFFLSLVQTLGGPEHLIDHALHPFARGLGDQVAFGVEGITRSRKRVADRRNPAVQVEQQWRQVAL